MLWTKQRQLFKQGTLSERKTFGNLIEIHYKKEWEVEIKRLFKDYQKRECNNFIFDIFREYEYNWQIMSARQISYLLWCDHTTIDKILASAMDKLKYWMENWLDGLLNKYYWIKKPPKEEKWVYKEVSLR